MSRPWAAIPSTPATTIAVRDEFCSSATAPASRRDGQPAGRRGPGRVARVAVLETA